MNAIKNIFLFSFVVIIFLQSCTPDENIPDNSAERDKFIGTWNVEETCNRNTYPVNIIADPDNDNQVILKNFWQIGFQEKAPYAIINGNEITIPKQLMCDNNSNEVEGNGLIDNKKIIWNYQVNTNGSDLNFCSATYSK